MQLFTRVSDPLREQPFDVHMDVLVVHRELHLARIDIAEDRSQALRNFVRVFLRDDSLCTEHMRMRDASHDIFSVHAAVKADGGLEPLRKFICIPFESSAP